MNGSSYIKIPLRSSVLLNIANNDKYWFLWSIIAKWLPYDNNHPNRVSNFRQNFDEINFQGFGFADGFKCTDVLRFNEINNLSVNIFELNFYPDKIFGNINSSLLRLVKMIQIEL